MNKIITSATLVALVAILAGCSDRQETANNAGAQPMAPAEQQQTAPVKRWYSQAQVERGRDLFQKNCAECHKPDASGDPNWKQVNAEGKLPPPPLNGTAHAWHHPLPLLRRIVRNGGVPMGGTMPPFRDKLKPDEIDAILAWVQSHWSDRIYATWAQINDRKKKG